MNTLATTPPEPDDGSGGIMPLIMARKPKRVALYVRVSTDRQTLKNQRLELDQVAQAHGWHIVQVFSDEGISGAKGRDKRPGFNGLLLGVTRKDFDLVAAWSVDRLGRSLQDLVGFLQELQAKKIDLYLHQQGLDTSTPAGRAMFQMAGVFAEFERAMIVERVKAGLRRAELKGTRSGKPIGRPKMSRATETKILELLMQGLPIRKVAALVPCGTSTVQRMKRALAAPDHDPGELETLLNAPEEEAETP
jgi:DNA invertase Pin-like site-specific DNA recombinase